MSPRQSSKPDEPDEPDESDGPSPEETPEVKPQDSGVLTEQGESPDIKSYNPEGVRDPRVSSYPDEVNHLGDQEAENTAPPAYPPGADIPSAQNVRRYPELFSDEVIAEYDVSLPMTEAEAEVMGTDLEGNPLEDDSEVEPEDEG